jgi:hypothetical protein
VKPSFVTSTARPCPSKPRSLRLCSSTAYSHSCQEVTLTSAAAERFLEEYPPDDGQMHYVVAPPDEGDVDDVHHPDTDGDTLLHQAQRTSCIWRNLPFQPYPYIYLIQFITQPLSFCHELLEEQCATGGNMLPKNEVCAFLMTSWRHQIMDDVMSFCIKIQQ